MVEPKFVCDLSEEERRVRVVFESDYAALERERDTYATQIDKLHEVALEIARERDALKGRLVEVIAENDKLVEGMSSLAAAQARVEALEASVVWKERSAYKMLSDGLERLCAAYRTGRMPSEATFEKIGKARALLSPPAPDAQREGVEL